MRKGALLSLAVMLVVSGGAPPAAEQQPIFRTGTDIVPIYVTVTDRDDRLVANLVREDFEVLDDGTPQEIVLFENDVQPITVVVMLDTSASMTPQFDLLQNAAEQFFIRLLPDDRGRVGAFNDKVEVIGEFTSDRDELIASLRQLDYGNPTRLYDAIALSLDELLGISGRRVVLVFSDGEDTDSRFVKSGDVLDRAVAEEVMIYSIGLRADYFNGVRRVRSRPDRILRRLAEETGGGYFELDETDELGPTFTRVAQELHSQYVLGFTPTRLDGETHELEVRVRQRGMEARARKTYVATGRQGPP